MATSSANTTDKALIRALHLFRADPYLRLPAQLTLHQVIETNNVRLASDLASLYTTSLIDGMRFELAERGRNEADLPREVAMASTVGADHAYTLRVAAQGRRGPDPHPSIWALVVRAATLLTIGYIEIPTALSEHIRDIAQRIAQ